MRFLQFRYNARPFVLLFLICTNVQFCQAYYYWWYWWYGTDDSSTSSGYSTPEECARQCQDNEPPKTCYYLFIVEYYTANNIECNFCQPPVNGSNIKSNCQCVISDGFEKTIFSINRTVPGPSIQVCQGDTIIVDVKNEAEGLETTIHWHGIFQNGYQYYDGVPHVTQCPIMSAETFRYNFSAENSGTHFYHSHEAAQILDGMYGSLIVRDSPSNNPYYGYYDEDCLNHIIIISDLFHQLSLARFPGEYRLIRERGQTAQNFLINGRGNWTDPQTGTSTNISLSRFMVEPGKSYRFRVINACATVCPVMVTIQSHSVQIIATDGEDINPVQANAFNMASGERIDFVLYANQTPGQYWIYVRGLGECTETMIYQLAILSYAGSSQSSLSPTPGYFDVPENIPRTFNPMNDTNCENDLCVDQTCMINMSNEDQNLLNATTAMTVIMPFDFFNYSSSPRTLQELFNPNASDFRKFFVAIDGSYIVSRLGNYSYTDPSMTLISEDYRYELLCGNRYTPRTCTEPCYCTHVYHVPLYAIMDVMIYDREPMRELNHPFHLHGYNFCVMEAGQFNNAANKSYITEADAVNEMKSYKMRVQNNTYKCCSPKDTVVVPNTGYVIMRFEANNPGWWFFHCHFSWHTMTGMNLVFHVGQPNDLPPVPEDFPECYNWTPT